MIEKTKIEKIINEHFEGTDKFLVDLNVSTSNQISVFIDGDSGVKVADCIDLSRHIEKNFNRDEEDYELEVSSTGVGKSLLITRQYHKNIGKQISVITNEGNKIKGKITEVTSDGITLDISDFLSKKEKKDGVAAQKQIPFNNIREAKIIFSFN